jgi:hypothetical protein
MKNFCIALTIVAALVLPARASAVTIHVVNTSDACAMVTASYSSGETAFWHRAGEAKLRPHETIAFNAPSGAKFLVDAAVHLHATCGGKTLYNTYDEKDGIGHATALTFELMQGNGRVWLWFTKFGPP